MASGNGEGETGVFGSKNKHEDVTERYSFITACPEKLLLEQLAYVQYTSI